MLDSDKTGVVEATYDRSSHISTIIKVRSNFKGDILSKKYIHRGYMKV